MATRRPAKRAKTPAKRTTKSGAKSPKKGQAGAQGKKATKKRTTKTAAKSVKKTAKKTAKKRTAERANKKTANKGTNNAPKKPTARRSNDTATTARPAKTPKSKPSTPKAPAAPDEGAAPFRTAPTQELIHGLAVGITRLSEGAGRAKHGLEVLATKAAGEVKKGAKVTEQAAASAARKAKEAAMQGGAVVAGAAAAAGYGAASATRRARERSAQTSDDVLATARGISAGVLLKAEEKAEVAAHNLHEMSTELANRARAARAAGVDFYERHREEIIALLITAAKIAAVIGVRRLAGPRDEHGAGRRTKGRIGDTAAILAAVVGQIGTLLAKQPSALPILREMYAKGGESEQAVVGMLLGPALSSDPDHAVEVIHEFLASASSEAAADTIARRTLAPLLEENPRLVDRVTPWVQAAAPLVQRGALLALSRYIADRRSRVGDILAASVVVLEDHDEEVRQALQWLFATASEVDLDAAARAVRDWARRDSRKERLVADLPDELRARVRALKREEGDEDEE